MTSKKRTRRISAFVLAAVMLSAAALPAAADSAAAPTYDEAYYATLDYYGNLTEGSIVKSYVLNGATSLTDYGTYESMVNLTDGTAPVTTGNQTTFTFDSAAAPSHFYFQGETSEPYEKLPWTLSLSYKLNGVPARAEELAGQKGVVEIAIDAIPNEKASSYTKHNYTLEAMALFNQDDILSLEAPGAQVQLIGNLRAVLFLALPGEEQHFTIRVGADSFTFDGMTFLMVPATLGQLEQVAELAQRKDDLEENYQRLSESLDTLLNSLDDVSSGLYDAAGGLDALNAARGTVSAGKGNVYSKADALRADLDLIGDALSPISGELASASAALSEAKETLGELNTDVVSLKAELAALEKAVKSLQSDGADLKDTRYALDDIRADLKNLQTALNNAASLSLPSQSGGGASTAPSEALTTAKTLYASYTTLGKSEMTDDTFVSAMLLKAGKTTEEITTTLAAYKAALSSGSVSETLAPIQQLYTVYSAANTAYGGMTYEAFVYAAQMASGYTSDVAKANAASLADLYAVYTDNPGTVDSALNGGGTLNGSVSEVKGDLNAVSGTLKALSGRTASLAGDLADLLDEVDALYALLDDTDSVGDAAVKAAEKGALILNDINALHAVLDTYEPEAQNALETVDGLASAMGRTVADTSAFTAALENLMQTSGAQLDAATRQSLSALASSLRSIADSLDTTESIRETKNSLNTIIEDTWTEHAGEFDALLLMDATAEPVSLTDSRNGTPQSVQIMIRTQEIKPQTSAVTLAANISAVETQQTTFWQRVGEMFHGILAAVIGIFHKGEVVNNA